LIEGTAAHAVTGNRTNGDRNDAGGGAAAGLPQAVGRNGLRIGMTRPDIPRTLGSPTRL